MPSRFRLWTVLFLRESLRALARHKLRSGLTTLGITVGISAVVLAVGVGEAGAARAEASLQALGDSLVWIEAGSRNVNGVRNGAHGTTSLTVDDAQAVRREVPLIRRISPQVDGNVQIVWGNRNWQTRYRGETPDYLAIKRWNVVEGSSFTQDDVDQTASKILIGQTVRRELFGDQPAVGEVVRIQGQLYEVTGVLEAKGQTAWGRDQDDWILLPYTTAQRKLRGRGADWLDDILCSAVSPDEVDPAIDRVIALLRERHHIRPGDDDDFNIRRPDEIIKAQIEGSRTLELLLVVIASVSLLVGGIGIMNIMLASVLQRTTEIGLRLAVGARESDVQIQFLGEAVLLGLLGGLLGVAVSAACVYAFDGALGWSIAISPKALALAIVASSSVGIVFGLYPARRAARLDPITALRRE